MIFGLDLLKLFLVTYQRKNYRSEAEAWLEKGVHCVPLKLDDKGKPKRPFESGWQARNEWEEEKQLKPFESCYGLGILIHGDLFAFDIESYRLETLLEEWDKKCKKKTGISPLVTLAVKRSVSGGYHLMGRYQEGIPMTNPPSKVVTRELDGKREALGEFFTDRHGSGGATGRGQVVAPPTPGYSWENAPEGRSVVKFPQVEAEVVRVWALTLHEFGSDKIKPEKPNTSGKAPYEIAPQNTSQGNKVPLNRPTAEQLKTIAYLQFFHRATNPHLANEDYGIWAVGHPESKPTNAPKCLVNRKGFLRPLTHRFFGKEKPYGERTRFKPLAFWLGETEDEQEKIPSDTPDPFIEATAPQWQKIGDNMPPVRWLFNPVFKERQVGILFADTNMGKTILAMQIALAVATGKDLFGIEGEVHGTVLYYDFELEADDWSERYRSIDKTHKFSMPENLIRYEMDPDRYDLPDGVKPADYLLWAMEQHFKVHKPVLIVVDNISYLAEALQLEEAKQALPFIKRLKLLKRQYQTTILLLAHTPKVPSTEPMSINHLAGSKTLANIVDFIFGIGKDYNNMERVYLKQLKARRAPKTLNDSQVWALNLCPPGNNTENCWLHFEDVGRYPEERMLDRTKEIPDFTEELRLEVIDTYKQCGNMKEVGEVFHGTVRRDDVRTSIQKWKKSKEGILWIQAQKSPTENKMRSDKKSKKSRQKKTQKTDDPPSFYNH